MKRSIVAQSNASISLSGERIVVAGGIQGIGEGFAYRFAKAGAEVWIVGRNETRGENPRRGSEEL
jgi:short-subunit dehydrogenase involved in D-alanine esterification of teichoic acids